MSSCKLHNCIHQDKQQQCASMAGAGCPRGAGWRKQGAGGCTSPAGVGARYATWRGRAPPLSCGAPEAGPAGGVECGAPRVLLAIGRAGPVAAHPRGLTSISDVSVRGGRGRHCLSIKLMAAVQLPWQSKSVVMMPPEAIPGKLIHLVAGGVASGPAPLRQSLWRPPGSASRPGHGQQPGTVHHPSRQRGGGAPWRPALTCSGG